jgi:hypothetical protein
MWLTHCCTHPHQVNVTDYSGFTPLHFAAVKGGERVATLLLRARADPNAIDHKGQTPLHLAAKAPTGAAVVRALLQGGAATSLRLRTLDPPFRQPVEVAMHHARSGARNAENARRTVAILQCASHPLSLRSLANPVVGGLLRRALLAFIVGAARSGNRTPRLPPEVWGRVLSAIPGGAVLEVVWRLEDDAAREAAARAERIASARAAAAESMDLFQQLAGDDARHLFSRPGGGVGGNNGHGRSDDGGDSGSSDGGFHRFERRGDLGALRSATLSASDVNQPTSRRYSAEAPAAVDPAALVVKAHRRGLPMIFEPDADDADGGDGSSKINKSRVPSGHPLPPSGFDASLCTSARGCTVSVCECPRQACAACSVLVQVCNLDDHAALCPRRAVLCPIGCGATVAAASLPDHYRLKCSSYFVRCWGCSTGVPVLRKEMEEHRTHWHTKRGPRVSSSGLKDVDGTAEEDEGAGSVSDSDDPFRGIPCPLPPQTARCPVPGCTAEVSLLTPRKTAVRTLQRHMSQCRLWVLACPGCGAEMRASEWAAHASECRSSLPVCDLGMLQHKLDERAKQQQQQ